MRSRWIKQVWIFAAGNTDPMESGSPLSPSQTMKNTSLTPRFFNSVRHANQNFADSPSPWPGQIPTMSL